MHSSIVLPMSAQSYYFSFSLTYRPHYCSCIVLPYTIVMHLEKYNLTSWHIFWIIVVAMWLVRVFCWCDVICMQTNTVFNKTLLPMMTCLYNHVIAVCLVRYLQLRYLLFDAIFFLSAKLDRLIWAVPRAIALSIGAFLYIVIQSIQNN